MIPKIRLAKLTDSPAVMRLSRQLGYPLSLNKIKVNLKLLLRSREHRLWVAEVDSKVVGLIHARVIIALNLYRNGEGYAAAVDEKYRSLGIGASLVLAMEKWLKSKGCNRILLYSNMKRPRAHALYERIGYKKIGTSVKMEKWI